MPAQRFRLPAAELKDTRGFAKKHSQAFIVRAKANGLKHPRIAVIVPAKVDRTAVGRHRMKRRVMERIRAKGGGWDVVVTALPASRDMPRKALAVEMDKLLP